MKQSAAKTLGVAVLGAAFAAAAAGTASAAVPAVGLTDALGTATGALQSVTSQQQVGADHGQESSDPAAALTQPVTGLLGGLPTSNLGG
ncbi:hypothetical protein AMK16_10725 [Streptomyces sp. CB00455]|uniref:hypothetical protein n=1 Tax=Streptomyces sp. CB00455 TaxID=1703927 RepID=UPI0009404D7D|nr:hypothetical protein [Streptomyces sp. CB00455]OKK20874.1 hypothetical protein AMK16_10725 [Streptomyces sp. CB00455]